MLVIMGATPEGKKELVGLLDGERESKIPWLPIHRRVAPGDNHPKRAHRTAFSGFFGYTSKHAFTCVQFSKSRHS